MKLFPKQLDRRSCKRFTVVGRPLAVMKPGQGEPGRVARISVEAVEILYNANCDSRIADTDELDILVADFTRGLYLHRVPVKTVSDCAAEPMGLLEHSCVRRRIVAFGNLTGEQRSELQSFIHAYAR